MPTDPTQFARLTQAIAIDMQTLGIHWKLYKDLQDAVDTYESELNEARTFWYLTFEAHRDNALFRLCRLFDQHRDSLSLKNWLTSLRDNPQYFSASQPDSSTLAADINSVSRNDSEVSQVVTLRDKVLAHRDPQRILSASAAVNPLPTVPTVEKLVTRAREIVNRYTSLLGRESYSTTMAGHDDYQSVLRAVRKTLEDARRASE